MHIYDKTDGVRHTSNIGTGSINIRNSKKNLILMQ